MVAGHTDAVGGEEYNQGLSERRADTIKRYLTEKYGINGSDLVTVGYGKTKPKDASCADGPGQPPRPGGQHGNQDRFEVILQRSARRFGGRILKRTFFASIG